MKFGRRLQEECRADWADQYINYKELKKAIKVITGTETSHFTISEVTSNFGNIPALAGNTYRPPESRFQDLLNFEVKKINCFACLQYSGLMTRLPQLVRTLHRGDGVGDLEGLSHIRGSCEAASIDVADLHSYIRLNFLGFRKITKKYDKHNQSCSSAFYLAGLLKEPFVNLNLDILLLLVNLCFAEVRRVERQLLGNGGAEPYEETDEDVSAAAAVDKSTEIPTGSSGMATTRYFIVSDADSMRLRLLLARYMPLALSRAMVKLIVKALGPKSADVDSALARTGSGAVSTMGNSVMLETLLTLLTSQAVGSAAIDSKGICVNPGFYHSAENRPAVGFIYFDTPSLDIYMGLVKSQRSGGTLPPQASTTGVSVTSPAPTVLRLRWVYPPSSSTYGGESKNITGGVRVILERVDGRGLGDEIGEWADVTADWQHFGVPAEAADRAICLRLGQLKDLLNLEVSAAALQAGALVPSGVELKSLEFLTNVLPTLRAQQPAFVYWCQRANFRREGQRVRMAAYAHLDEAIAFSAFPQQQQSGCSVGETLMSVIQAPPRFPVAGQQPAACPNAILTITVSDWNQAFGKRLLSDLVGSETEVLEVPQYSPVLHALGVLRETQLSKRALPVWLPSVQSAGEEEPANRAATRVDAVSNRPAQRLLHDQVDPGPDKRPTAIAGGGVINPAAINYATTGYRGGTMMNNTSARTPLLAMDGRDDGLLITPSPRTPSSLGSPRVGLLRRLFPWPWRLVEWVRPPIGNSALGAQAVRVEPKTFFANERTLLQWMNTAVLLSTIGITLLNFGTRTGRIAGLLMAPVAVFFLCYSFLIYLRRSFCLERREPINYNDRLGPTVLVLCLIGALSATILLNVLSGEEISYIPIPSPSGGHQNLVPIHGRDIHISLPTSNNGNNNNNSQFPPITLPPIAGGGVPSSPNSSYGDGSNNDFNHSSAATGILSGGNKQQGGVMPVVVPRPLPQPQSGSDNYDQIAAGDGAGPLSGYVLTPADRIPNFSSSDEVSRGRVPPAEPRAAAAGMDGSLLSQESQAEQQQFMPVLVNGVGSSFLKKTDV